MAAGKSREQYRSKLLGNRGEQPIVAPQGVLTRGMGSAYADNQKLAGASNPEAAAQMASSDPQELASMMKEAEEAKAEALDKLADMKYAQGEEGWNPPGDLENLSDMDTISEWHAQLEDWRTSSIDQDIEQQVEQTYRDSIGLEVDDPLYDPLRDSKRRKIIEADLAPLDFESMVFVGYTEQVVPIRENFELKFRTISTQHGMWIEMMLTELAEYSAQYGRHWFSLCQVAVALQSVNDKVIGPDISRFTSFAQKDAFRDALDERMEFLGRLPGVLSDEIIVQHAWFTGRVRKMMSGDLSKKVGNS